MQNFDPNTGEPVGVVLIAQTLNTLPNVNPGFRIFYLDPVTHQPLDYDQYYIDLVKANSMYSHAHHIRLMLTYT